jgi:hypothetical protein
MIYKFRVILDTEDDVFRDIAISEEETLEDLHNAIVNSFGYDGSEVGSFYTCNDEWEQQDEIPLFESDEPNAKTMRDFKLNEILDQTKTKIIYVYDFMNMWTFFVELAAVEESEKGLTYPMTLFAHGVVPNSNDFSVTDDDIYGEFEDDIDDEDYFNDEFEEGEGFEEDFGYDDQY